MTGSTDGGNPGESEPTIAGGALPGAVVSPPPPTGLESRSVLYGLRLLLPGTTTTTTTATTTGDAEFKKLKKLPYCPYAAANPFPKRPDAMTNDMLKLSDLHGDKTQTMLCIKSNSSMKFEQMVLGPALAYFHNAIVYEETPMDKI
ncbi:hypothetical protein CYMTET_20952 [Cymbomonas tetramitiformis]|uniref:Uncharacterized protein n=1 Tax=Cymbomonas tetramitiformis TaxID=36881 RepID=A0AAE0L3H4_9CHLO|nr:hypothetical protein CYMTET_20952 [Cymbomonas tetramitiformis]